MEKNLQDLKLAAFLDLTEKYHLEGKIDKVDLIKI